MDRQFYKMPRRYIKPISRQRGAGVINTLINKLPFELHLPGYQYCGPGTKLAKRIARGDPGINRLDRACREHDLAYAKYPDNVAERHNADRILAEKAVDRIKASDSGLGERTSALGVAAAMKAKVKLGMGVRKRGGGVKRGSKPKRKRTTTTGGTLGFQQLIKKARTALGKEVGKSKGIDLSNASQIAFKLVNKMARGRGAEGKTLKVPRIIAVPKTGGVLPLLPIFALLSALGALTGGAAGVAKAVTDADAAKKQLAESQRHNQSMEAIAIGKGLYLRPYKSGYGLCRSKNLK